MYFFVMFAFLNAGGFGESPRQHLQPDSQLLPGLKAGFAF